MAEELPAAPRAGGLGASTGGDTPAEARSMDSPMLPDESAPRSGTMGRCPPGWPAGLSSSVA